MTADPNSGQATEAAAPIQRRPTWKQILLLAGSAIVLGVTSCFGFVASGPYASMAGMERIDVSWGFITFIGLVVAVLMFFASVVLLAWRVGQRNRGTNK